MPSVDMDALRLKVGDRNNPNLKEGRAQYYAILEDFAEQVFKKLQEEFSDVKL